MVKRSLMHGSIKRGRPRYLAKSLICGTQCLEALGSVVSLRQLNAFLEQLYNAGAFCRHMNSNETLSISEPCCVQASQLKFIAYPV